jgi:hypothetical protein
MSNRKLKSSIISLGDTITRLCKQREPHLRRRLKLHSSYNAAVRRRDVEAMTRLDERICQLHRFELGPLNEKIARRETKIRALQRLMTGN